MAMRDICRSAEKRVSTISMDYAEEFDAAILHNTVAREIKEDEALRELIDVVERAYYLSESNPQREDVQSTAFGAAEEINDQTDSVREDAIAGACIEVVHNASDWLQDGFYERDELEAAVEEAKQWLRTHEDVVERVDIEVDLSAKVLLHTPSEQALAGDQ